MAMKVVHCKREPYDIYIGRPSVWGNPYSHLRTSMAKYNCDTREQAVEKYEEYVRKCLDVNHDDFVKHFLQPLVGKVLGCWCAPKSCHGDVLIRIINELGLTDEGW